MSSAKSMHGERRPVVFHWQPLGIGADVEIKSNWIWTQELNGLLLFEKKIK